MGKETPITGIATGSLAVAIAICSAMLLYNNKNPGNGNKCWQRRRKKKIDKKQKQTKINKEQTVKFKLEIEN